MASLSFDVMPEAVRGHTVRALSGQSSVVQEVSSSLAAASGALTPAQAGNSLAASAIDAFHQRAGAGVGRAAGSLEALSWHVDGAMTTYQQSDEASADGLLGLTRG